jgi:hypothetical protein
MDKDKHIIKRCSDCAALLEGHRVEPHEYLMVVHHTPDEDVYRCLLCDTCLNYSPFAPEAWTLAEQLDAGQPGAAARTSRPRHFR